MPCVIDRRRDTVLFTLFYFIFPGAASTSSSSTVGFVSNLIKSTFKSNDGESGDRKASVTSDQAPGMSIAFAYVNANGKAQAQAQAVCCL